MKLTDYKGEDALDLIADIIEPASVIFGDKELKKLGKEKNKIPAVKYVLKNHKKECVEILARLNGKTVDEYDSNIAVMLKEIMEIISDKELVEVFRVQGKTE